MIVQPIILAGGKGKRMGNTELPKVLTLLQGKPLISYLLQTLNQTPFLPAALVVGFKQEMVREALGGAYSYIYQEEQLGTGHAVAVCKEQLAGKAEALLVLYGDMPLWSLATIERLVLSHQESGAAMTLGTVKAEHPTFKGFGRIIRSQEGSIQAIREQKDCTEAEQAIDEVNPSLFCFADEWLWLALEKITCNNVQQEYYLTDLLGIAIAEGQKVGSLLIEDWHEALGVNTQADLEEASKYLVKRS